LIAPGIFGIREINEVLRLFSNLPLAWKSLKTFIISTLNTYQQAWKNAIEKPSGPDALKPTIPFTILKLQHGVKGKTIHQRSPTTPLGK